MNEKETIKPRILLRILLAAMITGIIGWIGDFYKDEFKVVLGNHYHYYLFSVLAVFLIFYSCVVLWGTTIQNAMGLVLSREAILKELHHQYQEQYNNKIDSRIELNLELKYTQQGKDVVHIGRHFLNDAASEGDVRTGLTEVVDEYGYVLVLGGAGAGKSTLLINTALGYIQKAFNDPNAGIPIIVNISSWHEKYSGRMYRWIQKSLLRKRYLNFFTVNYLLRNQPIILLLDGLDEIPSVMPTPRIRLMEKFLNDLKGYLIKYNPKKLVLTSRIGEYSLIEKVAPVMAQILIKPMTYEVLQRELRKVALASQKPFSRNYSNTVASQNLLELVKVNPELADVLCIPFYLNLASQVFGYPAMSLVVPKDIEEFKNYLLHTYIRNALNDVADESDFNDGEKNKRWLVFLSTRQNLKRGSLARLVANILLPLTVYTMYLFFDQRSYSSINFIWCITYIYILITIVRRWLLDSSLGRVIIGRRPLRLNRFLGFAVRQGLLERDRAKIRFRHMLIQMYFLNIYFNHVIKKKKWWQRIFLD